MYNYSLQLAAHQLDLCMALGLAFFCGCTHWGYAHLGNQKTYQTSSRIFEFHLSPDLHKS